MKTTTELGTDLFVQASWFARSVARNVTQMEGAQTQPSVVWRVMSALEQRGRLRASQISELERVSQPSIATTLQRLERLGYVSHTSDPTDNRATLFELEEPGLAALAAHRAQVAHYLAPHLDRLSDLDIAAIIRVCEILEQISKFGQHKNDAQA